MQGGNSKGAFFEDLALNYLQQQGLTVTKQQTDFLMLVGLRSPDGSVNEAALGDFMARNIIEELRRIDGVGRVQLFGAEQAMRIWLDPTRLTGYGLTMGLHTRMDETIARVTQASHAGNVTHAARAAKKNRRAFFELMRKYKIESGEFLGGALEAQPH